MTTTRALFRQRDFRVFLTSQGVSALGDAVAYTAMPLLVLQLTGSGVAMGLVGALQTIPYFLFGMVAGAIADRSDGKRLMFLADLTRGVLTALIPISVFLGGPTLAVIVLVTVPISVSRSFFMSAYFSSLPVLVGRDQFGKANATFSGVESIGWILGPAIAGVLAATIGPGLTLAIDAITFLLSAAALLTIRTDLGATLDRARTSLLADVREGIAFVAGHRILRAMILYFSATSILLASLVNVLAVHITRDRAFDESILGLILTAYSVGSVLGAVLAGRVEPRRAGPVLLGGTIVTGGTLVLVALAEPIPVLALGAVLAGTAQTFVLMLYVTVRTLQSPDALLARVGSTARTLSVGLQPIGLLAGGLLVDLTDGSTTILVIGVACILLTILVAPLSVWRLPTRPSSEPARAV